MKIAIGLPSTLPGVGGGLLRDWARAAEDAGFSSLGTLDRIVYRNLEPLLALTAAASVTQRIGLLTAILIAPTRGADVALGKQLATLDVLSDGRFTAGVAVGGRPDDYAVSDLDFERRGRWFDEALEAWRAAWSGDGVRAADPVGPPPLTPGGPPLLLGGNSAAAVRRTVRYGAGWISGGGGPDAFAGGADAVRGAWTAAGREGKPRLAALTYFALGPTAGQDAQEYIGHYYAFLGPIAEQIAASALTDAHQVAAAVSAYEAAGCDELVLFPCGSSLSQVDLLASAASVRGG
jgi:alkanesulfonate monooxygenase SsuD/methylene tetrahydromethanopterin reductase-like flavin-dependent oxidoreductase (luciferase family)